MWQLHPVTNALLGHLSLSAPPLARPPGSSAWKAASLQHKVFVSRCEATKAPSPSGQGRFDSYSEVAFHWQLFGQQPRQPATAARPFPRGRGSICPHNGRWSPASRTLWCHRTPAWFSCAIIPFLPLRAQWRAIRRKLPGNFLAHAERASKGALGKLLAWPPDYAGPTRDDVLLKRRKTSSCSRRKRSFFFSCSATSCDCTRMFGARLWYPSVCTCEGLTLTPAGAISPDALGKLLACYNEFTVTGDFNLNWLNSNCDYLKEICGNLNLTRSSLTRLAWPERWQLVSKQLIKFWSVNDH